MSIFDRFDTWFLLFLSLFMLTCWMIDRHTRVKRLEKEKAAQQKKIQMLRAENRQLRKDAVKLANRKEAAALHMNEMLKCEVESLKAEIARKDNLLNQKWKVANDGLQNE